MNNIKQTYFKIDKNRLMDLLNSYNPNLIIEKTFTVDSKDGIKIIKIETSTKYGKGKKYIMYFDQIEKYLEVTELIKKYNFQEIQEEK